MCAKDLLLINTLQGYNILWSPFVAHMPALAHLHARAPCLFSVCDERITDEVKEVAATGTLVEPVSGFRGSWAEQRAGECCIFTNLPVLLRVTVSVCDCQ